MSEKYEPDATTGRPKDPGALNAYLIRSHRRVTYYELADYFRNIFKEIDTCTAGKGKWDKEVLFYFKQILKFVAARIYFAHHFYKDDDLNHQTSDLVRNILKACIDSLLYFSSILK